MKGFLKWGGNPKLTELKLTSLLGIYSYQKGKLILGRSHSGGKGDPID